MASNQHHHHPTSREGQHGVQQQQQPYHVTPLVPLLSLVHHKYRSPRSLGRGEFGQAFVVLNTETQQHCVLKRLKDRVDIGQCSRGFTIDSHALRASLNEINALASVRHPFIVEFGEAWVDSSDQHLHIAMEYCPGGDLQEYLKKKHPVDEAVVRRWVVQLLLAVEHLHSRRIIHRDIKLANVFLTRDLMAVKLGDFGLSKILKQSDERGATQAGTPFYFSPEVAAGHTHDRKTDVWSLGVVFYILLNNDVPFGGKSFAQIFNAIRTAAPQPWKSGLLYTEELRALVDRMLIKDARTRPTTTELLSTPWMAPYLAQLDFELSPHRLFDTTLNSRGSPSGSHPGSGSQLAVDAESCYVPTTTVPSTTTTVTTSATKPMRMYFRGFTALDNNNDKARRRPLCVNVRPEPNVKGNVLHQIQNGDQITIDLAATVDVGPQPWYRVLVPIEGYCIATLDGQPLFLPCLDQPSPDVVRAPPPAAHPLARPPAVRRALSPTPPATLVPQSRSPRRVSPQPTTPSAFFPLQRRLFDDSPAALPTAMRPRSPVGVAPRTIAGRQAPSPARAVHVGSRVPLAAVSPSRDRSGVALPKQQRSPLRR